MIKRSKSKNTVVHVTRYLQYADASLTAHHRIAEKCGDYSNALLWNRLHPTLVKSRVRFDLNTYFNRRLNCWCCCNAANMRSFPFVWVDAWIHTFLIFSLLSKMAITCFDFSSKHNLKLSLNKNQDCLHLSGSSAVEGKVKHAVAAFRFGRENTGLVSVRVYKYSEIRSV